MNTKTYQSFFLKSEEGIAFVAEVKRLIESNHEKSESNPELSRDHAQRAKGNREVLDHILSITTESKKGKLI